MRYQQNLFDGAFYLLFKSVGSLNEINSKSFGKLSDRYQKFNKIFTTYRGGHQCSLLITKLMEHLNTRILHSAFLLIIRCRWYSKISVKLVKTDFTFFSVLRQLWIAAKTNEGNEMSYEFKIEFIMRMAVAEIPRKTVLFLKFIGTKFCSKSKLQKLF